MSFENRLVVVSPMGSSRLSFAFFCHTCRKIGIGRSEDTSLSKEILFHFELNYNPSYKGQFWPTSSNKCGPSSAHLQLSTSPRSWKQESSTILINLAYLRWNHRLRLQEFSWNGFRSWTRVSFGVLWRLLNKWSGCSWNRRFVGLCWRPLYISMDIELGVC